MRESVTNKVKFIGRVKALVGVIILVATAGCVGGSGQLGGKPLELEAADGIEVTGFSTETAPKSLSDGSGMFLVVKCRVKNNTGRPIESVGISGRAVDSQGAAVGRLGIEVGGISPGDTVDASGLLSVDKPNEWHHTTANVSPGFFQ